MSAVQENSGEIQAALQALTDGDQATAIQIVQGLFAQHGEFPEGLHILGLLALQMGELSRSIELMKAAHQQDPGCKEYAEALGIVFARSGRLNDSLYFGKLAIALKPHALISGLAPEWLGRFEENLMAVQDSTYYDDALLAFQQGDFEKAQENLQKEAELHPEEGRAWRMLARLMRIQGRPVESYLLLNGLLETEVALAADHADMGRSLAMMGKFDLALQSHFKAGGEDPRNILNLIGKLDTLSRQPSASMAEIKTAEDWLANSLLHGLEKYPNRKISLSGEGKLKVGLVSGRFRAGAGLDFLWPLLLHPKKGRLSFYCYSHNAYNDALTRRIGGATEDLIDLAQVNDRTAAEIIHNDGIDILIDLDGYRETGRPLIFALEPAPIMLRLPDQGGQGQGLGFKGLLGGAHALKNVAHAVVSQGGVFAFSDAAQVFENKLLNKPVRLCGWMPSMEHITGHALNLLGRLLEECEGLKLLLFVQGCGGVNALSEIEPMLDRAGLSSKIIYAEPGETMALGMETFLNQADVVLDLEGDACLDGALSVLNRRIPLLSLSGENPGERLVADLLQGIGLDQMIAETPESLAAILSDLMKQDGLAKFADAVSAAVSREQQAEAIGKRLHSLEQTLMSFVEVGE